MEPNFGWIRLSKKEKDEKYLNGSKKISFKNRPQRLHQHHTKLLQIFISEMCKKLTGTMLERNVFI